MKIHSRKSLKILRELILARTYFGEFGGLIDFFYFNLS